jgi:predicted membrane protein
MEHRREHRIRNRASKRSESIIGGVLLLGIGGLLLARQVGVILPPWLFTWPMIPIIVGLFVGAKTGFRDFGWLVLVGVGVFFLVDRMEGISMKQYLFPGVIIIAGLAVLLNGFFRRVKNNPQDIAASHDDPAQPTLRHASSDDVIEVISVFGSTKRLVLSKTFRGGEIISVFGSAEINLTNADFTGRLVLECVQIFGGTKLIVPPHWVVQTKTAAILGGIEDKRSFPTTTADPEKVLVLEGVTILGGVTITSY